MQRLLSDAEKFSGIHYDISSYADIIDAIHVIQTEMGITGTTAKEAASTISGSIGMMKSSWQNLITGVADDTQDFDKLIDNFVDSVDTVAQNITPRVEQALNGVGKLVEKLVPNILERVPELLNSTLPTLVSSATTLMRSLVETVTSNIDTIVQTAGSLTSIGIDLIEKIAEGITKNTDAVINGIARVF
ncbi:MAG TPA: PblA, partial [Ruminococcus flavefaciens]|nr:PblA [Ruminococcus flavefaciens]